MSAETIQELSDRVAKALGWAEVRWAGRPRIAWIDEANLTHCDPCNPLELLRLMVEYDVYPKSRSDGSAWYIADDLNCWLSSAQFNKDDPASKQEAFTSCALLGVLKRLEERGEG